MLNEVVLYILAFLLVVGVCVHHYMQQQQIAEEEDRVSEVARRAVSDLTLPSQVDIDDASKLVPALRKVWEAKRTIGDQVLVRGHKRASDLFQRDVKELLKVIDGMEYELEQAVSRHFPGAMLKNAFGEVGHAQPGQKDWDDEPEARRPAWYSDDEDADDDEADSHLRSRHREKSAASAYSAEEDSSSDGDGNSSSGFPY
jgi:hypothetical protein